MSAKAHHVSAQSQFFSSAARTFFRTTDLCHKEENAIFSEQGNLQTTVRRKEEAHPREQVLRGWALQAVFWSCCVCRLHLHSGRRAATVDGKKGKPEMSCKRLPRLHYTNSSTL